VVATRARFVFVLAVGFYLYALAVAAVFVAAGILFYAFIRYTLGEEASAIGTCAALPPVLFGIGSGLVILWNLIPRPRRFVKPGPRFDLDSRPRLREIIADVAGRTGQPMPSVVYMLPDVNASVTEKGGVFGFRKQRVLAVGLPLFSILTVSQLRAVLAHEFGHFYWGDTRLGPWIGRTAEAISLTMEGLLQAQFTAWLNLFFFWYAELFQEAVFDLSRKQEFLADQLAARVAGARAKTEAIQLVHTGDDALHAYWSGTVAPLLRFGVRVPALEGFSRFVAAQGISAAIERKVATHLQEDRTGEYDTHPSLPERVAAIAHMPLGDSADEDPLSLSLLGDLEEADTMLIGEALGKDKVKGLRFVTWEDACEQAYLPMWEDTVRTYAAGLAGVTPEALPGIVKNLGVFGMEMLKKSKKPGDLESMGERTGTAIGSALALALRKAGWDLHVAPGVPVYAQRGDAAIEPFGVLGELIARRLSPEEWQEQCSRAGIAGMDLGALSTLQPVSQAGT
jgi:heat shock protein HtpX